MARYAKITAVMLMIFCGSVSALDDFLINSSFESDGWSGIQNVTILAPYSWCDVNVPVKFSAYIDKSWASGGSYSLTMESGSRSYFEIGDIAKVSQMVELNDVNSIYFDIDLGTQRSDIHWDKQRFSAVIQIDGVEVWNSSLLGTAPEGSYYDIEVNSVTLAPFKDGGQHEVSLGLRANQHNASYYYVYYKVKWDAVRFDRYCEGFGYLREDFSGNCTIDIEDMKLFSAKWLGEAEDGYDMVVDDYNAIDFFDFSVLSDKWGDSSYLQDSKLFDGDLNYDGIVNLVDFAIMAGNWGGSGDCRGGDIDRDGVVDINDFKSVTSDWMDKNWIYYLKD